MKCYFQSTTVVFSDTLINATVQVHMFTNKRENSNDASLFPRSVNATSHIKAVQQRHLEALFERRIRPKSNAHRYVSPAALDPRFPLPFGSEFGRGGSCQENRRQQQQQQHGGVPPYVQQLDPVMGEVILPRRLFLWCMSVIYLSAFVSLYVQIPGEHHVSMLAVGELWNVVGKTPLGVTLLFANFLN